MSNLKPTKEKITTAVLAEIRKQKTDYTHPLEYYIVHWWTTGRNDGLRLKEEGHQAFKLANIEYYDVNLDPKDLQNNGSWYNFLIQCSKKIKCPYYIGLNKEGKTKQPYMRFFDSKIAMMITLYGNIFSYIDSINVKKDN